MRFWGLLTLAILLLAVPAMAQNTYNRPLPDPVAYHLDSGARPNATSADRVVFQEAVHIEMAGWLRLYFADVQLEGTSFLRITSMLDGEVQELDAAGVKMWNDSTAYFNGDAVILELVAAPVTDVVVGRHGAGIMANGVTLRNATGARTRRRARGPDAPIRPGWRERRGASTSCAASRAQPRRRRQAAR